MNQSLENLEARSSIDLCLGRQRQTITQASVMADQKASISLALQLGLLTLIVRQFTESSTLSSGLSLAKFWWLLPLGLSTLVSVVLCLYVLMPSIGPLNRKGPARPLSRNPLFFSSIAQYSEEEYLAEMAEMFQKDNRIYRATLIDLHRESVVLFSKKYRFLDLAYRSFLLGILTSAGCFLLTLCF